MKPKRIFIDTGAWINFILENEPHHQSAVDYFEAEINQGTRLFISNLIIVETTTRLLYDHSLSVALEFKNQIEEAEKQKRLTVIWIDEAVFAKSWKLFAKYAEHKLSLTDASNAVLMKQLKLSAIFAFDDDFKKIGLNTEPV